MSQFAAIVTGVRRQIEQADSGLVYVPGPANVLRAAQCHRSPERVD
jgi:hypothetical protein